MLYSTESISFVPSASFRYKMKAEIALETMLIIFSFKRSRTHYQTKKKQSESLNIFNAKVRNWVQEECQYKFSQNVYRSSGIRLKIVKLTMIGLQ